MILDKKEFFTNEGTEYSMVTYGLCVTLTKFYFMYLFHNTITVLRVDTFEKNISLDPIKKKEHLLENLGYDFPSVLIILYRFFGI